MAFRTVARIVSLLLVLLLAACVQPAASPTPTAPPASASGGPTDAKAGGPTTEPGSRVLTPAAKPAEAARPSAKPAAAASPAAAPGLERDRVGRPAPSVGGQPLPPPRPTPIACCSTGGNAVPNDKPYDSTFYQDHGTNPFVDTEDDALSTFAMDVDTASYTVARRYLKDGHLPERESVRVEEYVNFFNKSYRYPQPEGGRDFEIALEAGPSPFGGDRYELVMVGIQGRNVSTEGRKPASLTFVIDVSGSMNIESRLGTVKKALALLVDELRSDDSVGIAIYGTDARVLLPPTRGSDRVRIRSAIDSLTPSGSTNVEAGLRVGFDLAEQAFGPNRTNMVLLLSDGVANNGVTDADGLLGRYRRYLERGIQLSTFGFGMGNFNDVMMERLANGGNGRYAYVDSLDEARRLFVQELSATLQTIARDAKVQVEFNPRVVSRYRLLGYENRDVADKDFRNDRVDAGEVGAGQSVTALYEVKRVPGAVGDLATVRIRYQRPDGGRVVEEARQLSASAVRSGLAPATPRFKLAASVAQFAELLRGSYWAKGESLDDVIPLAREAARGLERDADVQEFLDLVTRAVGLKAEKGERTIPRDSSER